MSNSVEHAYVDDLMHTEDDETAKWWTFAGIHDKNLTVVICDKGVGIPSTLPKTQGVSVLMNIFKKLRVPISKCKGFYLYKGFHVTSGNEDWGAEPR